jgi:hypothetical protein
LWERHLAAMPSWLPTFAEGYGGHGKQLSQGKDLRDRYYPSVFSLNA